MAPTVASGSTGVGIVVALKGLRGDAGSVTIGQSSELLRTIGAARFFVITLESCMAKNARGFVG